MPPTAEPADLRQRTRCASSATSSPPSSPRPRPQAVDAADAVVVDYDPLPGRSRRPPTALAPDAPLLFPEHGSNVCFGTDVRRSDVDPLEGADAVAEVTMVSQRLAGVPMETNGILAVPGEPTAASRAGSRTRRRTRVHGAIRRRCSASSPSKLRVVCPWVGGGFGPKAAVVRRVPRRRGGGADARPPGEVGRDPLGGHGLARPRPRLRDDRQARRRPTTARSSASTATSSPSAGAYPAIGAILPMLTQMMSVGVYDIPKVAVQGHDAS